MTMSPEQLEQDAKTWKERAEAAEKQLAIAQRTENEAKAAFDWIYEYVKEFDDGETDQEISQMVLKLLDSRDAARAEADELRKELTRLRKSFEFQMRRRKERDYEWLKKVEDVGLRDDLESANKKLAEGKQREARLAYGLKRAIDILKTRGGFYDDATTREHQAIWVMDGALYGLIHVPFEFTKEWCMKAAAKEAEGGDVDPTTGKP